MKYKKLIFLFSFFTVFSCAELQQVMDTMPTQMDSETIARGLRQALDQGIDKQVTKLTQEGGFYNNQLVKIMLPQELQKVDKALRDIGLSSLADEGLKILNSAAENAVKEATPIFVDAVQGITFADAKNILLGADDAATSYLEQRTDKSLYQKFNPVIQSSFSKVGADRIWANIIDRYNAIPFVQQGKSRFDRLCYSRSFKRSLYHDFRGRKRNPKQYFSTNHSPFASGFQSSGSKIDFIR